MSCFLIFEKLAKAADEHGRPDPQSPSHENVPNDSYEEKAFTLIHSELLLLADVLHYSLSPPRALCWPGWVPKRSDLCSSLAVPLCPLGLSPLLPPLPCQPPYSTGYFTVKGSCLFPRLCALSAHGFTWLYAAIACAGNELLSTNLTKVGFAQWALASTSASLDCSNVLGTNMTLGRHFASYQIHCQVRKQLALCVALSMCVSYFKT